MEWFHSWFESPYYHTLYANRDDAEASRFLTHLLPVVKLTAGAHILDLACGKGRHSIWLNKAGYNVTGVDISQHNIEQANRSANPTLHFKRHDMRVPFEEGRFDLVLNAFTSFGYFEDVKDNDRVLAAVHDSLKPNGRFVLDFLHADYIQRHLVPSETRQQGDVTFEIEREVLPSGFLEKRIHLRDASRNIEQSFRERVYLFSPAELKERVQQAGFTLQASYGDYFFTVADSVNTPRVILIAGKATDNVL